MRLLRVFENSVNGFLFTLAAPDNFFAGTVAGFGGYTGEAKIRNRSQGAVFSNIVFYNTVF